MNRTSPRRAALRTGLALVAAIAGLLPLAGVATSVPAPVAEQFDPTQVRALRLSMEPLPNYQPPASFYPADWDAATTDPDGVTTPVWTEAQKAAWLAEPAQQDAIDRLARAAAWDVIRTDTTNTIRLAARFHADDTDEAGLVVGVRRKSSRALPSEADPQKVGLKVGFSDVVKGQLWRGVSRLSLENGGDISPLYEGLAWNLHQMAHGEGLYPPGHDPALAAWVTLAVNGQATGVYASVEQRNKQFMRNRDLWTSGESWLYKQDDIGAADFDEGPDPREDGSIVHSPTYQALCYAPFQRASAGCPTPDDATLAQQLPEAIDMNVMLTQGAIDAFSANNDALISKGKNAFFVDRAPLDGDGLAQPEPRRYFPWDLDAVFGGSATSGQIYALSATTNKRGQITGYTQSDYQRVILNHPDFRRQFNRTMLALLDGPLATAKVHAFLDAVSPALAPALAADPYGAVVTGTDIDEHFASVKSWVDARNGYVRDQIAKNKPDPRPAYPGSGTGPVATETALLWTGPTSVKAGANVTLQAALTAGGAPVSGATVTLAFNKSSYAVVTDAGGLASRQVKAPAKTGSYGASATFAGTTTLLGSSTTASISVTK